VPKISGVPHQRAIRAFEKTGFRLARKGAKHVVMTDGERIITIPRHDPVNALTMGGIVRDAGLTEEEFRKLL
jgi:predicted RNA binding protein YcfA (HicA-like mRNA interferase family)